MTEQSCVDFTTGRFKDQADTSQRGLLQTLLVAAERDNFPRATAGEDEALVVKLIQSGAVTN